MHHHPLSPGSVNPTRFSHRTFFFRANPTLYFQSLRKHEAEEQQLQPSKRFLLGSWSNQPLGVAHPESHVIIMERVKQRRFNFKEISSPLEYSDIVSSATHKGLRGPNSIIFYRRGTKPWKQGIVPNCGDDSSCDFEKIKFALYASLQGGPFNNHFAALAICFKQGKVPVYKVCMQWVTKSANALASALLKRKCRLVTNETHNHLLLRDLKTLG
ncbi:Serine hydroxymethyltransferase 6 [Spatholobus suberectus]|nr:Serine hydroxymethyltransferase 6 [Spatholobus suberectus]